MRVNWLVGMALWAGLLCGPLDAAGGQAGECGVEVALRNPSATSSMELARAKNVATGIFAGIGVAVRWGGKAGRGCSTRIEVRLETSRGAEQRPDSMAYTTVGANADRRIHIFVDRVNAMVGRDDTGMLLGHVVAHEIAHILEGMARHSERGVMKAHWERKDLHALVYHPLRFEPVDEALIHAGLAEPLQPGSDLLICGSTIK